MIYFKINVFIYVKIMLAIILCKMHIIISFQIFFPDLDNNINIDCIHVFFEILKYNWNMGWWESGRAFTRGFKGLISFQLRHLINKLAILSCATRYTSSLLHHACSSVSSSRSRYLGVHSAFFSFPPEGEARFLNRANASTHNREKWCNFRGTPPIARLNLAYKGAY